MKQNLLRLILAGALALGLAAGTTTPVQAATTGTVSFFGTAWIGGTGLVYPGINTFRTDNYHIFTYDPITKSFGSTSTTVWAAGPRNQSWDLNVSTVGCVSEEAGKKGPVAGNCTIQATGTVSGWCGNSSGRGTGTYLNAAGQVYQFEIVWTTSAGGELIITGRVVKEDNGQLGTIDGAVTMVPRLGCLSGGATTFDIVGEATLSVTSK